MTEGVTNKWDCAGCGLKCSSFGALGNHARFSTTCTPEMRFWGKVDKSAGAKAQVEAWAAEQHARVLSALRKEFGQ